MWTFTSPTHFSFFNHHLFLCSKPKVALFLVVVRNNRPRKAHQTIVKSESASTGKCCCANIVITVKRNKHFSFFS